MSIREIITGVLNQRQSKAPKLERINTGLTILYNQLGSLQQMTTQASYQENTPKDIVDVVSDMSNHLNDIREDIVKLNNSVSNLAKRFSRGTINIGVAGKTGQGKSTLLQKISGLSNTEIPTSDKLACTGTKSKIYHSEGTPYAKIEFYRKGEFLKEIIHPYFDKLKLPAPFSLEDFLATPLPQINSADSSNQVLDEAIYEGLRFIHEAFPYFREHLSKEAETVGLEQIQKYVVKYNEHTKKGLTDYLAVKMANIHTKFPKRDVTGLCLVDLPGLEAAQGHEKKLVASLEHEVDAVVLIKLPARQRPDFDEVDYKVIGLINNAVREVELANWLFTVLNELDDGTNTESCQLLKQKLSKENPSHSLANILIANCNDSSQVEEQVFSVVLNHLEQNLGRIDRQFINALSQNMKTILDKLNQVLGKAQSFFSSEHTSKDKQYNKLLKRFMTELKLKLESLLVEMNATASSFSEEFKQEVIEVCNAVKQTPPVPDHSELKELVADHGGFYGAIEDQLNFLRSHLTSELATRFDAYLRAKINIMLREVLNRIFPDSLQSLLPPDMDPQETLPHVQISALSDLANPEEVPVIHKCFNYISQFDFSYQTLLHYRVRGEMDKLNAYNTAVVSEIVPPDALPANFGETAEKIAHALNNAYQETVFKVKEKLIEEMDKDPSYAIFALVEEVKDRLVRTKDIEDEWYDFLYPIRAKVWPEIYKALEADIALRKQWKDALDKTISCAKQLETDFAI